MTLVCPLWEKKMNASLYKSMMLLGVVAAALAGCATIAPERDAADKLMGQNIREAYKQFGNPTLVLKETSVKPSDKLYGQNIYLFQRVGASYNKDTIVGSSFDHTPTGPVNTIYHRTDHFTEACNVSFWAGKDGVIDFYEVKGNCGLWNAGFGTTGALHRVGIN